jgi:rhamnulokinase
VHCGFEEATLLGNVLVQAIARGELASVSQAREVAAASFAGPTYEPQQSAAWQEARTRFEETVAPSRLKVTA